MRDWPPTSTLEKSVPLLVRYRNGTTCPNSDPELSLHGLAEFIRLAGAGTPAAILDTIASKLSNLITMKEATMSFGRTCFWVIIGWATTQIAVIIWHKEFFELIDLVFK